MDALHNLDRLRLADPRAAAEVVDALWAQLAREDARMFAALWRRANLPGRRAARQESAAEVTADVTWVDDLEMMAASEPSPPRVNLVPERRVTPRTQPMSAQVAALLPL
jgi:hypothetical protein